jgi:hypothetical protein
VIESMCKALGPIPSNEHKINFYKM